LNPPVQRIDTPGRRQVQIRIRNADAGRVGRVRGSGRQARRCGRSDHQQCSSKWSHDLSSSDFRASSGTAAHACTVGWAIRKNGLNGGRHPHAGLSIRTFRFDTSDRSSYRFPCHLSLNGFRPIADLPSAQINPRRKRWVVHYCKPGGLHR